MAERNGTSEEERARWQKRRCTARSGAGHPCRAWAIRGSDPARCAAHQGRGALRTGQAEQIRFQPGEPAEVTIDGAIAGLVDKMQRLDEIIGAHGDDNGQLVRLFTLYSQTASRLGRLLRDRQALSAKASSGISAAIDRALDEVARKLDIDV